MFSLALFSASPFFSDKALMWCKIPCKQTKQLKVEEEEDNERRRHKKRERTGFINQGEPI